MIYSDNTSLKTEKQYCDVIVKCEKEIISFVNYLISNELHDEIMKFRYEFKNVEFNKPVLTCFIGYYVKTANKEFKKYIVKIIKKYNVNDIKLLLYNEDEDDDTTNSRLIFKERYPELYHTIKPEKLCYDKALFVEIIYSCYNIVYDYIMK